MLRDVAIERTIRRLLRRDGVDWSLLETQRWIDSVFNSKLYRDERGFIQFVQQAQLMGGLTSLVITTSAGQQVLLQGATFVFPSTTNTTFSRPAQIGLQGTGAGGYGGNDLSDGRPGGGGGGGAFNNVGLSYVVTPADVYVAVVGSVPGGEASFQISGGAYILRLQGGATGTLGPLGSGPGGLVLAGSGTAGSDGAQGVDAGSPGNGNNSAGNAGAAGGEGNAGGSGGGNGGSNAVTGQTGTAFKGGSGSYGVNNTILGVPGGRGGGGQGGGPDSVTGGEQLYTFSAGPAVLGFIVEALR